MQLPDVNVLVALLRESHPHHATASAWLEETANAGEPFSVSDVVATGLVRVGTNPRIWQDPATTQQVFDFLDDLRAEPTHLVWVTSPRAETLFRQVALDSGVTGPRVSHAWIAATALAYKATVVTFDRDFRRFDGVEVNELPLR